MNYIPIMQKIREMPTAERPNKLFAWLELRAPFEFASLIPFAPWLASAPKGDGRPVLLAPGFAAGESTMKPLSLYLSFLNYQTYDWGLGVNRGEVYEDIDRLGARVESLFEQLNGQPITLIGWSLGGVIAREVARLHPERVREVITLGTPVVGGPKYTTVGEYFADSKGIDLDELEREVDERNSLGLSQPVTSIYSREDGVVGWRAAIDTYNPHAKNVRVSSSHIGLGVNPQVWLAIAKTLADQANSA